MNDAADGQKRRKRPIQLVTLCLLEGVTSLFLLLWFVLLPEWLFLVTRTRARSSPLAFLIVVSAFAVLGLVTAGGLWACRAWAFRLGLTLTICVMALALFWLIVTFSFDLSALGLLLVLLLKSILLLFFLQPMVARALVSHQRR
jgi:hypothetical protein